MYTPFSTGLSLSDEKEEATWVRLLMVANRLSLELQGGTMFCVFVANLLIYYVDNIGPYRVSVLITDR